MFFFLLVGFSYSQETNPEDTIKGPPLPCTSPSTQASNFTATTTSNSTIDLSWTRGDGDNVIILAHEAAPVDSDPISGNSYTANATFGIGDEIGTGNFVVYNNSGTSTTVDGLNPSTTYYFKIYEYLNVDVCYLIPGISDNATTDAASPVITSVSPDNFFTDKGKTLTITGSDLGDLTTNVTIGGVSGNVTSNDGTTLVVDFPAEYYSNNTLTVSTGVSPDATETVTVNKRNIIPVGGGTDYHTTIQSALDGLAAWYKTTSFDAGQLPGAKYIDVYSGTYAETPTPDVNLGTSSSSGLFIQNHNNEAPVIDASGLTNGIYIGDLTYVTIQGFTIHSADDALIYIEGDKNTITHNQLYGSTGGSGLVVNNSPSTTINNNLIYNNYNFGIRLINSDNAVVKNNTVANNGHSAKAPPLPSIYDPAELYVESGTGVNVENNIFYAKSGINGFCLKTETGITVNSDYNTYFKNGNSFIVFYDGVVYADITAWSGNGAGTNDIDSDPDFVNAGSDWHIKSTAGSYAGGEWPPYTTTSGTWTLDASTSPALDAGNPGDDYSNEPQSGNIINQGAYGNTIQASKTESTCTPPSTQASNFTAIATGSSTIDLSWTRGDGDNVIILAHEGAPVDSDPISGNSYTANATFGIGDEIGTGNFVVYNNSGTSTTVDGLNPSTTYYFKIYEYLNVDVCYLIPGISDNATTDAASPVITSVSPDNFFTDKGKTLTITGSDLGDLTTNVTIGGVSGNVTSNDGTTLVVDFPAEYYSNNTLTVSTGVSPDATETVTVNKRNIIPVGGGTDYHTTIQSALDGLAAWYKTTSFDAGQLPGAKYIDVYSGTYAETPTPDVNLGTTSSSGLFIQNHVAENPVIDASGLTNGIYIGNLAYVTVKGFTIHSADDAIIYTEGDNNSITHNRLYGSTASSGIVLNNAPSTSATNNLVYNNYNFGIRLINSDNAVIKNNTVANNGHSAKAPPLPSIYDPAELYVESGTGVNVENNIFYAKSGINGFCLKTETGITVNSDYNTYFKNGNSFIVFYDGVVYADITAWSGNGAGTNDIDSDPDFVNAGSDWHIKSTAGSYAGGTWPPFLENGGSWILDATTSPALDAGNPGDDYSNEPQSGNIINQGAYGNTAQASKSAVDNIHWTGAVSEDWQTPGNWSPAQVPSSGDNAIIPDVSPNPFPLIDDGTTTAQCFDLHIDAGSSVTIAPNGEMTVYGDITNNSGASNFVVESDATGDGSLIQNTIGVDAEVQRFLPTSGSSEWHFISSPVTAAPTSLYGLGMYDYDETQDDWWSGPDYFYNGISGWSDVPIDMVVAKGYIWYGGQETKVYQGKLNAQPSYSMTASYTTHTGNAPNGSPYSIYDGWVLLGNPYPCSLDWEMLDKSNDITSTVYYYDDDIDNYAYYQDGGTSVNGGSQYIPSGQSFFIKTNDATDGGSLLIPEFARTHNDQNFWKKQKNKDQLIRLKVNYSNYFDETLIKINEFASDNFDDNFDAYKHYSWNNQVPQIFTLNKEKNLNYAINSFPFNKFRKEIPLGYIFPQSDVYIIKITENTLKSTFIILRKNNKESLIKDEFFNIEANDSLTTDKYELVLEKNVAPVIEYQIQDKIFGVNEDFCFSIPENFFSDKNTFDKFKITARTIEGKPLPDWINFDDKTYTFYGKSSKPTKINIKLSVFDKFLKNDSTNFTINIKSNTEIAKEFEEKISAYPIPVKNILYIKIGGEKIKYKVCVSTAKGDKVFENNFSNENINKINLENLSSGIYILSIVFEDNSKILRKIIKE